FGALAAQSDPLFELDCALRQRLRFVSIGEAALVRAGPGRVQGNGEQNENKAASNRGHQSHASWLRRVNPRDRKHTQRRFSRRDEDTARQLPSLSVGCHSLTATCEQERGRDAFHRRSTASHDNQVFLCPVTLMPEGRRTCDLEPKRRRTPS